MTAIEMVTKRSKFFFNPCPRSKRKCPEERLKDFTTPKPLDAAPVMPHYNEPEPVAAPTPTKIIFFQELQTEYTVPEFKLLRYVLLRAYQDLGHGFSTNNEDQRDARSWILSSSTDPFSFLYVCEHLDVSDASIKLFRKFACDTLN